MCCQCTMSCSSGFETTFTCLLVIPFHEFRIQNSLIFFILDNAVDYDSESSLLIQINHSLERNEFLTSVKQRSFVPFIWLRNDDWILSRLRKIIYDRSKIGGGSALPTKHRDEILSISLSCRSENFRIAGELRLRVVSSKDAASFESGKEPVPDDLDTVLEAFPTRKIRRGLSQVLYTLNDSFVVDFRSALKVFCVISDSEQAMYRPPFHNIFNDGRDSHHKPYKGAYNYYYTTLLSILLYWLFSWIFR